MDSERLILGFERAELESKRGASWTGFADVPGGFEFIAWFEEGAGDSIWKWHCRAENATQRESVLVAQIGPVKPVTMFRPTQYHSRHYPALSIVGKDWKGGQAWDVLTTWQWLAYAGGGLNDWSGFARLRADVKLAESAGTLWLAVEDDEIEPPVVAKFRVPKGKWVTIELDLARAAKERGLNLAEIANFWILGAAPKTTEVLVDNIRIAGAKSPAALAVIRDARSFRLAPRKLPAKPKVPALPKGTAPAAGRVADEPAREILEGSVVPFGFLGAYDGNRLILGRTVPAEDKERPEGAKQKIAPCVAQSADGGRTWQALPPPAWRNLDHGTARGSIVDARGDAVTLSSGPGCVGPGRASPRQHLTKYTFAGDGWERRALAAIVDCDIRHCCSNFSCVRLARGRHRGRLWGAWGSINRKRMLAVHAAFSDDDGRTWWPWGRTGMVPGSRESKWWLNTYAYQQPRLAPFGDEVACVWQDSRGLVTSAFDGKEWSAISAIDRSVPAPTAVSGNESFRVPGSVVSSAGELFATAWRVPGVLRFSHGRWANDLPDACGGGALAAAGERVVLVTSGSVEQPPPEKRVQISRRARILAYVRSPGGGWSSPIDLAGGEVTLHEYRQMAAVILPAYGPADFVPVAWSDSQRVWLKRVSLG